MPRMLRRRRQFSALRCIWPTDLYGRSYFAHEELFGLLEGIARRAPPPSGLNTQHDEAASAGPLKAGNKARQALPGSTAVRMGELRQPKIKLFVLHGALAIELVTRREEIDDLS